MKVVPFKSSPTKVEYVTVPVTIEGLVYAREVELKSFLRNDTFVVMAKTDYLLEFTDYEDGNITGFRFYSVTIDGRTYFEVTPIEEVKKNLKLKAREISKNELIAYKVFGYKREGFDGEEIWAGEFSDLTDIVEEVRRLSRKYKKGKQI